MTRESITRRKALATIGAGAAATAAGGAALTVSPDKPDAELLSRVADFHRAYQESCAASEAWHKAHDQADAHPDCPSFPLRSRQASKRYGAFLRDRGVSDLADRSNDLGKAAGGAANVVFALPARTLPGVLAKFRIVRLTVGDNYQGNLGGDEDLDAFQEYDAPWFPTVIADLERLAGRAVS
jgi:hypothetical protein